MELMNASGFLEALGIAQIKSFVLDNERMNKYVLTHGHHLGSGLHTEFVPGEDLTERPIAIQTLVRDELIELYGEAPNQSHAGE